MFASFPPHGHRWFPPGGDGTVRTIYPSHPMAASLPWPCPSSSIPFHPIPLASRCSAASLQPLSQKNSCATVASDRSVPSRSSAASSGAHAHASQLSVVEHSPAFGTPFRILTAFGIASGRASCFLSLCCFESSFGCLCMCSGVCAHVSSFRYAVTLFLECVAWWSVVELGVMWCLDDGSSHTDYINSSSWHGVKKMRSGVYAHVSDFRYVVTAFLECGMMLRCGIRGHVVLRWWVQSYWVYQFSILTERKCSVTLFWSNENAKGNSGAASRKQVKPWAY